MLTSTSRKVNQWLNETKSFIADWYEKNMPSTCHDIFGLTINSDFLKILKINNQSHQPEVCYFAAKSLPVGLVSKNQLIDVPQLATILEKTIAEASLTVKNIAISLPRSSAIVKTLNLDNRLTMDEVETRIWTEANRLFPDLISDIYLDFAITGPSQQDADQNEVVIIACRKSQLQPYIDLAEQAGLNLKIADINYYALERAIALISHQTQNYKTVGVLSISYTAMQLMVVQEGKVIYSHELNYDGSALHKIEKNSDGDPSLLQEANIAILHTHVGSNLKHLMQFFYTSRPNVWIDKLIIADDCAATLPGLTDYIKKETNKEVELADPFAGMKIASHLNADELHELAPSLLLCCGLAVSKPNR